MTKRTRYTEEFKRQAIELLENRDQSAVDLARELGVRQNQLYKWREQLLKKGDRAFKGPGRPTADQTSEVSRLKQESVSNGPTSPSSVQQYILFDFYRSYPTLHLICYKDKVLRRSVEYAANSGH